MLKDKYYRIEIYNRENHGYDDVWIGNGKICIVNSPDIYLLLILYRHYIHTILTEANMFMDYDYMELLMEIPNLKTIHYIDCGYYPCTSRELRRMLTINRQVEEIKCIPSSYWYDIDPSLRHGQVDNFVIDLYNDLAERRVTYSSMKKLLIPLHIDDAIDIKVLFPNLEYVGIRYIYNVTDIDNYNLGMYQLDQLAQLDQKYSGVTVFLYLTIDTPNLRVQVHRNPEIIVDISKYLIQTIKSNFSHWNTINMMTPFPSLMLTRDNWLFETTY
jgi:hypothetical protein